MRRIAPVLLILLAAAHAAAEENPGPLSESKQQLKQLQKDQSSKDHAATGADLKGLIPGISTPGTSGAELPPPPDSGSRPEGQHAPEQKSANWLLEGYDKLGTASGRSGKGVRSLPGESRDKDRDDPDTDPLHPSAGKRPDARTEEGRINDKKSTQPPDPMEPFLKAWLANSPVKDAIYSARDSAKRQESGFNLFDTELTPARDNSQSGPATLSTSTTPSESSFGAKTENPYLQALNAPLPVTSAAVAPPLAVSPTTKAAGSSLEAPAIDATTLNTAKNNTFSGPASQAKDDKKYFPQLKRF